MILRTRLVDGLYTRLMIDFFSEAVRVVWFKSLLTWDNLDLLTVFRLGSLNEEFNHLLCYFFDICIVRTQAAKSQKLGRQDPVFSTGVV